MTSDLFRQACGRFATGVAVVTACSTEGVPHGLTVNSFSSLSLDPPLVMVAIDRAARGLQVFEKSGTYAVNILRQAQRDLSERFAAVPEGRFADLAWHRGPATGAPVIEDVLAVIECRTVQVMDAGDHRVFIGEVVEARLGEGPPLVYFNSSYTELV